MPDSMMPYAEYVIMNRALPRVEDGLKPVQRRILYSMYEQNIGPDGAYKIRARSRGLPGQISSPRRQVGL